MPSFNESPRGIADAQTLYTRRSAVLGESFPIGDCTGVITPSTGMLYLSTVLVEKNRPVTTVGFKTGTTAGTGAANFWFGIWTHDTAGSPPIQVTSTAETYSVTRTSGSPTLTIVSGTFPNSLTGRLVTGTGIPGSTRIVSQTTTTLTMSANASSGTATVTTVTIGQYAGPRQNIAVTADSTTTVQPAADTFIEKALTTAWVPPASGLVYFGWMYANTAGVQANIVGKASPAVMGTTTWNHLAHSNAGPHTTPPGAANPIASVTDVVNWAYCYYK